MILYFSSTVVFVLEDKEGSSIGGKLKGATITIKIAQGLLEKSMVCVYHSEQRANVSLLQFDMFTLTESRGYRSSELLNTGVSHYYNFLTDMLRTAFLNVNDTIN